MLANGSAAAASYFASERAGLTKPSVLTNFQLPSAFSPPKYIGISLDQVSKRAAGGEGKKWIISRARINFYKFKDFFFIFFVESFQW